jgi:lysozyme family protein
MYGITQATYDSYRRRIGKGAQSVRKIAESEVQAIYREQYWNPIHGDKLPVGVDLAVFDYAVNSGVPRAIRSLQKVLNTPSLAPPPEGIKQDGQLGINTDAAIQRAYDTDEVGLIELYCADRFDFVKKLRTFSTFGKGWTRRIEGNTLGSQDNDVGVIDIAVRMAVNDHPAAAIKELDVPPELQGGKANTEDVKVQATAEGTASGTAAIGTAGTAIAHTGVSGFIGDQIVNLGQLAGFTKDQIEPYISFSTYLTYAFVALGILGVVGMVAVRVKKQRDGTAEA